MQTTGDQTTKSVARSRATQVNVGAQSRMDEEGARDALHHVAYAVLERGGFNGAKADALSGLAGQLQECEHICGGSAGGRQPSAGCLKLTEPHHMAFPPVLHSVAILSTDSAIMAGRDRASPRDVLDSLQSHGMLPRAYATDPSMAVQDLKQYAKSARVKAKEEKKLRRSRKARVKRRQGASDAWIDPMPGWLSSGDELELDDDDNDTPKRSSSPQPHVGETGTSNTPAAPSSSKKKLTKQDANKALREVWGAPSHLPPLPPRHTWAQTPAFAPRLRNNQRILSLPLLDRKLQSARLVESSLHNLIRATGRAAAEADLLTRTADNGTGPTASAAVSPRSDPPPLPQHPPMIPEASTPSIPSRIRASVGDPFNTPTQPSSLNRRIILNTGSGSGAVSKGRSLSLRLRTPSLNAGDSLQRANAPPMTATPWKGDAGPMSASADSPFQSHWANLQNAPQSAILTDAEFRARVQRARRSHAGGSFAALDGGAAPSTPIPATPTTPWHAGAAAASSTAWNAWTLAGLPPPTPSFAYPPTPTDVHLPPWASSGAQVQDLPGALAQQLPQAVNYKAAWYGKAANKALEANAKRAAATEEKPLQKRRRWVNV